MTIVRIDRVTRSFRVAKSLRRVEAVAELTTELGPGVVAVVGPSGAGKSTLLRMLSTEIRPSDGTILVDDHDLGTGPGRLATRRSLGYVPQRLEPDRLGTAWSFVERVATLKEMDDRRSRRHAVAEALDEVGLVDCVERRIGAMPGGHVRQVCIAQAFLGQPRLLVLDDPMHSLDQDGRARLVDSVVTRSRDAAVVVASTLLADFGAVASAVVVMRASRMIFAGSPTALAATAAGQVWESDDPDEVALHRHQVAPGRWRCVGDPGSRASTEPTAEDGLQLLLALDGHGDQEVSSTWTS